MSSLAPRLAPGTLRAFTLLEMLIVVGLVAVFSTIILSSLLGLSKAAALQAAQSSLSSFVTGTRAHAVSSGRGARLCLNVDPTAPDRFLRYWVVQVKAGTIWQTTADSYMPANVYVVPGAFSALPAGLFSTASTWLKSDNNTPLRSSALRDDKIFTDTINETTAQKWVAIDLSATGGTAQSGDLILVTGIVRAAGSFASGDSPVELREASAARGLTLSSYGVPTLVNDVLSF